MRAKTLAWLQVLVEDEVVDNIPVTEKGTLIGRSDAELILDDDEVSSGHCRVCYIGSEFHVIDLNSTNGTYLNNKRIVKSKIYTGDILRLGSIELRFVHEGDEGMFSSQSAAKGGGMFSSNRDSRKITSSGTSIREGTITFDDSFEKVVPSESPSSMTEDSVVECMDEMIRRLTQDACLFIHVQDANGDNAQYQIKQREFLLGRSCGLGQFSQDEEVSRRHAKIVLSPSGHVYLEDMGSTNGTFKNGKKISQRVEVSANDDVKVGKLRLNILVK